MIEGIITGILAIAVCMINNIYQRKNLKEERKETIALIEYKLEELTRKVNEHNNLIDRTYKLEEESRLASEKFREVNRRLNEIEEKEKG